MAKVKIMLDAGHYDNYNQSPAVPEYWESKMTWKLQNFLIEALSIYRDVEVGTTRTDQTKDLSLEKRGKAAEGCDLFISLHSNACDTETVDRVDFYAPLDGKNRSHEFAKMAAEAVADLMGVSGGYVKTKEATNEKGADYYSVMYWANRVKCPMYFIFEHSFHTNAKAARWLLNDDNLRKLAELEADIIAEWFGLELKESFIPGDINGNGKIDVNDYILLKRAYFGTFQLTEEQKKRADINGDGKITATDYILLKRKYLGTYKN